MTSGAPWSVKGIDPKAREVAKDLARRSGMTLGEWLNRMILEEEGPEEITSQSYFTDPDYAPRIFGERAERTYYETPRHEIFRGAEPPIRPEALSEPPSRYEAPSHPGDEIGRVTDALERLTERIETSEGRTGAAISGVEHSVREAISRIEAAERDHVSIAARFEGVSEEARADQQRLVERVRRMEAEASGPRSAEALRALEQALGRVANHLYEGENRTRQTLADLRQRVERAEAGQPAPSVEVIEEVVGRVGERLTEAEARTSEALESLRASFSGMDRRVASVEAAQPGQDLEQRFQQLSDHLKARFESTRGELVQALEASAESRFDRMERKLTEMAEQVREAEHRSAQAIERVGQEMLTVADNLNRRVASSETRSADAIGQVSGEIARIANTVETRLSRNDTIQAEAMERLGGEIARISERLAERIANAERRSAQAFDEVGEQVARVTEKINQRSDNASDALVERIRQSEERTARLLEEAREKIDARLSETQKRIAEQVAAQPQAHLGLADRTHAFGEPEPFPDLPEPAAPPPPTPARPFNVGAAGAMTRTGFATPPPRPVAQPPAAPPTFEQLAPAALQVEDEEEDPFGASAEFEALESGSSTEPDSHQVAFEAPEPKAEAYEVEAHAPEPFEAEAATQAAAESFETPRAFAAESFPAAPDQRGFDAEDFEAADGFAATAHESEDEDESFEPELELAEPHGPAMPAFRSAITEEPVGGSSAFDAAFDAEPEPEHVEAEPRHDARLEAPDEDHAHHDGHGPGLQDREIDRALLLVRPEGSDRGRDDDGQRRAHRERHADILRHALDAEELVEHRHDDGPAADAEDAGQEPGHRARGEEAHGQDHELGDGDVLEHGNLGGRKACTRSSGPFRAGGQGAQPCENRMGGRNKACVGPIRRPRVPRPRPGRGARGPTRRARCPARLPASRPRSQGAGARPAHRAGR